MPRPTRRQRSLLVLLCAGLYFYVFPYQPTINNPNEYVRFYMTAAIAESGTYAIDSLWQRWGWVNDAATHDDHMFSVKAPGTSFLGVPAYAAYFYGARLFGVEWDKTTALWLCRVTASVLPTLVWLYFAYGWLARRIANPLARDTVFVSMALGSLLYAYALLFVSHTLSAVAAFGAFMLLSEAKDGQVLSRSRAWFAGLLAASVTLFEYPGILITGVLTVYAVLRVRPCKRLLYYGVGAAVPTLVMMHFQWRAFGSPFTPGHRMLENQALRTAMEQGFFGAATFSTDAVLGLTFDPGYGLFALTPILLFAFAGAPIVLRRRSDRLSAVVALVCIVGLLTAVCFLNNWRGGWTVGPRYLAAIVPFVAWFAAVGVQQTLDRFPRAGAVTAVGATIAAVVLSGIASAWYPHLPPEIERPLPEVLSLLLAHGFAPYNAANWAGVFGTLSMIPWFVLVLAAIVVVVVRASARPSRLALLLAGSIGVGAALLVPAWTASDPSPTSVAMVSLITRTWHPEGHDHAAELAERASAEPAHPSVLVELAETYEREGSVDRAAAVRRRLAREQSPDR